MNCRPLLGAILACLAALLSPPLHGANTARDGLPGWGRGPFRFSEFQWEQTGFTGNTVVANTLVPFKEPWLLCYSAADCGTGMPVFTAAAGSTGATLSVHGVPHKTHRKILNGFEAASVDVLAGGRQERSATTEVTSR